MRPVLKMKLWCQYTIQKLDFANLDTFQKFGMGQSYVPLKDVLTTAIKTFLTRRMTSLARSNGLEMDPIVSPNDTLVVRRLPCLARFRQPFQEINVGDVVVLKDPLDSDKFVVRKLAAVEGYEMASTDEDDEPFVLEEGQAWVLSANTSLPPKESRDSRTYGPVSMSDIIGRVVYRFRSLEDEGFIVNNKESMNFDMPVLHVEFYAEDIQRFTVQQNEKAKTS